MITESNPMFDGFSVKVVRGDVPEDLLRRLGEIDAPEVSIDIETTGLDFRSDKIGSIQVFDGQTVYIVRPPFAARILAEIVGSERVVKIFHHAMFDLRFLVYQMKFRPKNIRCTKIAAKIVLRDLPKYSLVDVVAHYLGRQLDKGQQISNWMADALSDDQVLYAVRDVVFLPKIMKMLMRDSLAKKVRPLVGASFGYIPTRVALDIDGAGDVFTY